MKKNNKSKWNKKITIDFNTLCSEKIILKSLEKVSEAVENCPDSNGLNYYMGVLLNRLEKYNEALFYLKKVANLSNNHSCEMNVKAEMIMSYIGLEDYESALKYIELLRKEIKEKNTDDEDLKIEIFAEQSMLFCHNKLGIMKEQYYLKYYESEFYLQQLTQYNHDLVVKKLTEIRDRQIKNNRFGFREDIDIELLVTEVEAALPNARKFTGADANDTYYFFYPNANNYNDATCTLIMVTAIRGTNSILSIFPCRSDNVGEERLNYYDFKSNQKKQDEIKKSDTVNKFYAKYKKYL